MRLFNTILLVGAIGVILAAAASTASAAVYWRGHRVTASLVGAIDAWPCNDPKGCVRGVVEVSYRHRQRDHLVRCGHPKHLHVVGTFPFAGRRWVNVYACSKNYYWRLP